MSLPASSIIRNSCNFVLDKGIVLHQGAWFDSENGKVSSCCAIGAVLLANGIAVSETPQFPGYVRAACKILGVNSQWLYRFWMGFDRGYQIRILSEDGKTETFDDISGLGIQIRKEFLKK